MFFLLKVVKITNSPKMKSDFRVSNISLLDIFFKKNEEVKGCVGLTFRIIGRYLVLLIDLALVRRKHCVSTKARFSYLDLVVILRK
jgi:hypothetical protein